MKTIRIPLSHVTDWLSHPGWWATFDDPGLSPGDRFAFDLRDAPPHGTVFAECLSVRPFTAAESVAMGLSLCGWTRVEYRAEPVSDDADWGDAELLPDGTHDVIGQGRRVREEEERLSEVT